jgi:2-iminobutanoate/2-iminopropanoate deaminase
MEKKVINSDKIGGTYSATTAHGTTGRGLLFVTGQVANRPGMDPREHPDAAQEWGTIEEQTVQVLENIKAILEEAGTSFDNVLKRNVYLTHLGDFEPSYKVMEDYFPSHVASTGVLTGLVPNGSRIEIDVIAVVPD